MFTFTPIDAIFSTRMDDHTINPTRYAALREAVERADTLAVVQARLVDNQQRVIELLEQRIKHLESMVAELKCSY
jgi:hypothetical protein